MTSICLLLRSGTQISECLLNNVSLILVQLLPSQRFWPSINDVLTHQVVKIREGVKRLV